MDRDLLARRLYVERVNTLLGEHQLNEDLVEEMWQCKASPADAAKAMLEEESSFQGPAWLNRYLNRK